MIRLFEMFAGYGGASFALKKAKIPFECVGYSEIDKHAIKVYNQNHPGIKNYGDCTKINPNELSDFDLLTGGFPCQPFSVNTNHKVRGENHKHSNLFMSIIKILEVKKPKYIILENVKGILGKKSEPILKRIKFELKRVGYDFKIEQINSKDYGTPQNRERVLFIGKYGSFNEGEYKFPIKEDLKMTVLDILETDVVRREPRIIKMKLQKKINIEKYGKISRYDALLMNKVDKKNSNVMYEILDAPSNTVSRQNDRIYKPTYSPCLTATGKDYLFKVRDKVIVLTPRECARIMGFFNDEINFSDISDNQKYKLLGNGWDVNFFSKLFKCMFGGEKMDNDEKDCNIDVTKNIKDELIYICNLEGIKSKYKVLLIKNILEVKEDVNSKSSKE